MRLPDPKANTTTEAYLAYKAGFLEESELKPVLYEPYLHFDGWLAYWAGLTDTYPDKGPGKNLCKSLASDKTQNGVTMTKNADGTYTATGTPTGAAFILPQTQQQSDTFPAGIYTFSLSSNEVSRYVIEWYSPSDLSTRIGAFDSRYSSDAHAPHTLTTTEPFCFRISLVFADGAGQAINYTCGFQIEAGSTATEYEEYHLIPDMLCDEEALVAYLSGVTDTYPEEIKDPYDVRITGYLRCLCSYRFGRPDYPVNNEEFYLSTMDAPHTSNSEPSSDIELDTAEGKIISVEAYGDTFQQTYSGKNLLPILDGTISESGLTVSVQNGIVTVNGTTTSRVWIKLTNGLDAIATTSSTLPTGWKEEIVIANENGHTISSKLISGTAPNSNARFRTYDDNSNNTWQIYPDTSTSNTFISDGIMSCFVLFVNSGVVFDNAKFEMQLESGSTATPYEPYVGGIPSPNPDYPQDIKVVTGEQTVNVHGKNLLDTSGIIWNGSSTGIVTNGNIEITNLSNGTPFRIPIKISAGTTFTLSLNVEAVNGGDCYWQFYNADETLLQSVGIITSGTTNTVNRTLSYSDDVAYIVCACSSIGTKNKYNFTSIQIENGSDKTSFEPFTSQSYPISLDIGNMALMSDFQIGGMNGGNPSSNIKHQINNAGHPIKVSPNTQYTISVNLGETVKGMRVGIHSCDANLTFISDSGWKQLVPTAYTFTTGANVEYVKLIFSLSTTSSTVSTGGTQDTTQYDSAIEWFRGATIKMNAGSSVIPDIELCKIGTYQDYIYKSGDDWYVHKECTSKIFDGSENWTLMGSTIRRTAYYVIENNITSYTDGNETPAMLSDHFISTSENSTWVAGLMSRETNSSRIILCFDPTAFTTLPDLRNWLSTHNTTVYYPLATATDTKVTDATLIGQLNALAGADTYNEKTYIKVTATDPNLPALLKVEAYKY